VHGKEPWISDGTPEGTRLLTDLNPGPAGSGPDIEGGPQFSPLALLPNGRLIFWATDGAHGFDLWVVPIDSRPLFHRGDPNLSSTSDISDAITIFGYLFLGEPSTLSCQESADANNDGEIDISDGINLLSWLFTGGPEPAAPGPTGAPCGVDPDEAGSPGDLGCDAYPPCQ
jgi:ELWxxDGT repeat protein